MKAVDDDLLQAAARRLVELFHPEQMILFGSHAWETPMTGSDIDLMAIVTQSSLSDHERSLHSSPRGKQRNSKLSVR